MSKRKRQGCEYQGYEFGAMYLDSVCVKGRLYDADNCDDKGNLYRPTVDIPCPICHPRKAVIYHGGGEWLPTAAALVKDIRSHCDVKTGRRVRNAEGAIIR